MPNGRYDIPEEVYSAQNEGLKVLDKDLEALASKLNGKVEINYHDSPNRLLLWKDDRGVDCEIAICAVLKDISKGETLNNYFYAVDVSFRAELPGGPQTAHKLILKTETFPNDPEKIKALLGQCLVEIAHLRDETLSSQ